LKRPNLPLFLYFPLPHLSPPPPKEGEENRTSPTLILPLCSAEEEEIKRRGRTDD